MRQLDNALEYAVALCQGQTLQVEHLPPEVRLAVPDAELVSSPSATPAPVAPAPALLHPAAPVAPVAPLAPAPVQPRVDKAEQLRQVLNAHQWNRQSAAEALGISRTTLWRRMRALGLE